MLAPRRIFGRIFGRIAGPLPRRAHGFSLLEIVVTLAIFGLVIALGAPSFATQVRNTRINNVAEELRDTLQFARQEAVRRNRPVQVRVTSLAPPTWEVVEAQTPANVLRRKNPEESAGAVRLIPTPAVPIPTATFDAFGRVLASNPGGGAPFSRINVTRPEESTAQVRELDVVLNLAGTTRICAPQAPANSFASCFVW